MKDGNLASRFSACGSISDLLGIAIDVVLPPRCIACGMVTERAGLCANCWVAIDFIVDPACSGCGTPFSFPIGEGALCSVCTQTPPPWRRTRAAIVYNDASRGLFLGLKYRDRLGSVPVLARWMAQAAGSLLREAELVVPVPSHWHWVVRRRYNHSAELARSVARLGKCKVAPNLLHKTGGYRRTRGLTRIQREENLHGSMFVSSNAKAQGARVLVIDDVMTTGATAREATRVLADAGARSIDILVLGRRP